MFREESKQNVEAMPDDLAKGKTDGAKCSEKNQASGIDFFAGSLAWQASCSTAGPQPVHRFW
jgi:hypothetical protein